MAKKLTEMTVEQLSEAARKAKVRGTAGRDRLLAVQAELNKRSAQAEAPTTDEAGPAADREPNEAEMGQAYAMVGTEAAGQVVEAPTTEQVVVHGNTLEVFQDPPQSASEALAAALENQGVAVALAERGVPVDIATMEQPVEQPPAKPEKQQRTVDPLPAHATPHTARAVAGTEAHLGKLRLPVPAPWYLNKSHTSTKLGTDFRSVEEAVAWATEHGWNVTSGIPAPAPTSTPAAS